MTSDGPEKQKPVPRPTALGTQQFTNPKFIAAGNDIVMLSTSGKIIRWIGVVLSILMMLLGVGLIVDGVYNFGGRPVQDLFSLATHPLIGLGIGVLATAVLQSSSTTTALTVTAVGVGLVNVHVAIPIILGANIGTTVTAMLVSFSFIGRKTEFRRAFSSAALHSLFNILLVAIVLPIEMLFSPLERLSSAIATSLVGAGVPTTDTGVVFTVIFQPVLDFLGTGGLLGELLNARVAAVVCLLVGTALILIGVRLVSAQLRTLMASTTRTLIRKSSGASDALGFATGVGATVALQASTVTVSSLLPFAAERSLKPRELLSITLGANVGTTVTSLVISMTLPGGFGGFAVQAALVHMLFNVIGTLLVLLIAPFRNLIIVLAEKLSLVAERSYTTSFTLIMVLYILLPSAAVGLYSIFR